MRELAREEKGRKTSPDDKIPMSERRKSIDLKQAPIIQEKFSSLRKVLVIEFFIKHFINMATKSNEFRAYVSTIKNKPIPPNPCNEKIPTLHLIFQSQSAMYIMHVENLCAILLDDSYDLGQTTLDRETIEEYLVRFVDKYLLNSELMNILNNYRSSAKFCGTWLEKKCENMSLPDFLTLIYPPSPVIVTTLLENGVRIEHSTTIGILENCRPHPALMWILQNLRKLKKSWPTLEKSRHPTKS